jgi:hypothetical protein
MIYKVYRFSNRDSLSVADLENLLNRGWKIDRADHDGDTGVIVYILWKIK